MSCEKVVCWNLENSRPINLPNFLDGTFDKARVSSRLNFSLFFAVVVAKELMSFTILAYPLQL